MTYSCDSCRATFISPGSALNCPKCGSSQVSHLPDPLVGHVTWITETFSGPPEALAAQILDLIKSGATGSLSLNLKDGHIGTFEFRRRAPRPPRPLAFAPEELIERWDAATATAQ